MHVLTRKSSVYFKNSGRGYRSLETAVVSEGGLYMQFQRGWVFLQQPGINWGATPNTLEDENENPK